MVGHKISVWLAALLLGSVAMPASSRGVDRVVIQATGLHESSNDPTIPQECRKFQPTENQVRHFFAKAYPVERYVLMHSRYSSCYATGMVFFSDGHFGKWRLFSGGVADLEFNRGDMLTVFHGNNKWIDPFAGGYDYKGD
ncbi:MULTISPECIES: hypothetical protein [Cupriavidus]